MPGVRDDAQACALKDAKRRVEIGPFFNLKTGGLGETALSKLSSAKISVR